MQFVSPQASLILNRLQTTPEGKSLKYSKVLDSVKKGNYENNWYQELEEDGMEEGMQTLPVSELLSRRLFESDNEISSNKKNTIMISEIKRII